MAYYCLVKKKTASSSLPCSSRSHLTTLGFRQKYCVRLMGGLQKMERRSPSIPSFNLLSGMLMRWLELQQPSCTMKRRTHPKDDDTVCLMTLPSCLDALTTNFFSIENKTSTLFKLLLFRLNCYINTRFHYFQTLHPHTSLMFYFKAPMRCTLSLQTRSFLFLSLNGGNCSLTHRWVEW